MGLSWPPLSGRHRPHPVKWVSQAQFAATSSPRQGLLQGRGPRLTIKPGGPDVAPPQVIAVAAADVVVDWMPSALALAGEGVPLSISRRPSKKSGLELTAAPKRASRSVRLQGKTSHLVWRNEYPFLSWMSKLGYKTDGSAGASRSSSRASMSIRCCRSRPTASRP